MNLFQSIKGAVQRTRGISEEEFKNWRRESTDPLVRSGVCYVPIPGKERIALYRDKQNLHHLGRYEWAKAVLTASGTRPERVLDCACGVGFGTAMLSQVAGFVEGVDIFKCAIRTAKSRYSRANIRWHELDAAKLREVFKPESFDAIVSFQTIECLEEDRQFLDDLIVLLKPGGKLLIDTPTHNRSVSKPENPHHRRNYSVTEWIDLLVEKFDRVDAFDSIPEQARLERSHLPSRGSIACCHKPDLAVEAD